MSIVVSCFSNLALHTHNTFFAAIEIGIGDELSNSCKEKLVLDVISQSLDDIHCVSHHQAPSSALGAEETDRLVSKDSH